MKRILMLGFACLWLFSAQYADAQKVETLVLSDGTELTGYVSVQNFNDGVTFYSVESKIVMPSEYVHLCTDYMEKYDNLSSEWKEWADANNWNPDEDFNLNTIELKHKSLPFAQPKKFTIADSEELKKNSEIPDVHILMKGDRIIFVDMHPYTFTLSWDVIECQKRQPRDEQQLNGLVDVLRKGGKSEELKGTIVEQKPGKEIQLQNSNRLIEVLKADDIVSIRKERVNADQTLLQQSPLIETIVLKTGEGITGLIKEQNFDVDDGKGYSIMTVEQADGSSRIVPHVDVKEILRKPNPDYVPLFDKELAADSIMLLNDREVKFAELKFNKKKTELRVANLDSCLIGLMLDEVKDGKFIFEVKNINDMAGFELVPLYEKGKKKKVEWGFTTQERYENAIRPEQKSVNSKEVLKMTFVVTKPGLYLLYQPKQKRGIVCKIKEK